MTAHYAGDGIHGASDSTTPTQVTVSPEGSIAAVSIFASGTSERTVWKRCHDSYRHQRVSVQSRISNGTGNAKRYVCRLDSCRAEPKQRWSCGIQRTERQLSWEQQPCPYGCCSWHRDAQLFGGVCGRCELQRQHLRRRTVYGYSGGNGVRDHRVSGECSGKYQFYLDGDGVYAKFRQCADRNRFVFCGKYAAWHGACRWNPRNGKRQHRG